METKKATVEEIRENCFVEGLFLVKDKNGGMTKGGKQYLALNLTDRTGEVKARIWDNAEKLGARFSQGDIVTVKAFSVQYQGLLQLNINAIDRVAIEKSRIKEFLPASNTDPESLFSELLEIIGRVSTPPLRSLLDAIFSNPEVAGTFKTVPAAKSIHHDHIGGLIDHTVHLARLAEAIAPIYPNLDSDLLITGALLHDIGKIKELSYEKGFGYTDRGRLIGHITLGDEFVSGFMKNIPGFPEELELMVRHLLLSHHGQYEFGSPKRPKTPEALLLSYIDDLDSKMFGFLDQIKKERNPESKWTSYNKIFDRYLYTNTFRDTGGDKTDPAK